MSVLSIASRVSLEAEREDRDREIASILLQVGTLKKSLPQNAPRIDFRCYTVRAGVRKVESPKEGL